MTPAQSLKELIEKRKALPDGTAVQMDKVRNYVRILNNATCDLTFLADVGYEDTDNRAVFIAKAANWTRTHGPALLAEIERYRKALDDMAQQKLTTEVGDQDAENPDYEGAYDTFIYRARAALNPPNAEDV